MIGDETQESNQFRNEQARLFAERVMTTYLGLPENFQQVSDVSDTGLWMKAARLAYLETSCVSCGGSPSGPEHFEGDEVLVLDPIQCKSCDTEFVRFDQGWDCAYHCSSTVFGAEVRCGYGSIYDMDTWKIKGDQGSVPNGLICDPCINRLRDEGKIARTGGLSWP